MKKAKETKDSEKKATPQKLLSVYATCTTGSGRTRGGAMSNSYRRIGPVAKGNAVLKYLAKQKEPAGAAEIGQAVGMPKATVMCYLHTHEDDGFVQRINDRWQLGLGLGLIRHRIKSNLEGERDRIERDLLSLEEAEHGE